MAVIGNINPTTLLTETATNIEKITREAISKAGRKGYILAPGCDIPIGSPVENIKAMLNIARQT
jgi:uroporphyrinogen decarboxylase